MCLLCGQSRELLPSIRGKYCSNKCQKLFEYNLNISKWLSGDDRGWTGKSVRLKSFVRRYLLEKYNYTCNKCGWNKRHPQDGKPLVEINHIDGDATNCVESNLEVLCPNCHSETRNFRARNSASSRKR